ncbi:nucleoside diphosphate kinase 2, chloroplastic [Glycine max]|uniref:nucleoside diphosphate kinase 2, chloroplastic n=1 Tax=Glycine max TaxID=3847 RepID=UPI000233DC01|nr:nucleoside diphosphate kinase 2, chloroplastic [Glycine max]
MEAVCGSFWVTSSLPRSPKSTLPLFRSTHQHLIAFPSQFHLFLYRPPPYANAKTLCARTSSKPAIFLPHLIASLEQVDQTYIMVKPDGMQRGLVGEIIFRFEKKGFKLTDLKLFKCSKELAEEHYKDLKQKSFFPKLIDYITSGPVVCMAWEGVGVVASARKLIGATYPLQAEPDTIRGDLTVQTRKNVVHGSDNPENGKHEIDNEDSLKLKLKEAALEFSWSITKIRAAFPESTTQLSSPPNSCSVENAKGKSSAVILKFELFHTPTPEIRSKIARKGNFQNVELQVDSLAVVKSITGNNEGSTNA